MAFVEVLLIICNFLSSICKAFYYLTFRVLTFRFILIYLFDNNFTFLFLSFFKRTKLWLFVILGLELFQISSFRKLVLLLLLLRLKIFCILLIFSSNLPHPIFLPPTIFHPLFFHSIKKFLHLIPKGGFKIIDKKLKNLHPIHPDSNQNNMFRQNPDILAFIDQTINQIRDHLFQVAAEQSFFVFQKPF